LRPRLDLWFGIPQVTRRVALIGGLGLRLVRVSPACAGFTYVAGGSLEVSVGVGVFF
jgi:hypothetical protein